MRDGYGFDRANDLYDVMVFVLDSEPDDVDHMIHAAVARIVEIVGNLSHRGLPLDHVHGNYDR